LKFRSPDHPITRSPDRLIRQEKFTQGNRPGKEIATMTQPDVALTDFVLACECLVFAYLLKPARTRPLALAFIVFFLSLALASAVGGTVHGFFEDPSTSGHRVLWTLTLFAIGVTAFSGTRISALLVFHAPVVLAISRAAALLFVSYCLVILLVSDRFLVAIINYLPVVLFLAWALLIAYGRSRRSPFLIGFAGVCVMLVAAGVQQAKLGIHPRYFNHNAVYHVLQGIGLAMLFLPACDCSRQSEV
jgi:hypothetical protein